MARSISCIIVFTIIVFNYYNIYSQENSTNHLFTSLSSNQTGITFRNIIVEDSNLFFYKFDNLYNGSGVAIGDINNDGLPDIYFSATIGSNKLYLNLGNFKFKDITDSAGVSGGGGIKTGVNMIDINKDGYLDIFICKDGPFEPKYRKKILYINNKNGTFSDKAAEYGLDDESYTTQTYFFDYDNDGDMDAFFVDHPSDFNNAMLLNGKIVNGKIVLVEDSSREYTSDRLYRNDKGHFTDVSKSAGVLNNAFGLSASICDINNDGWPDIYKANDFAKPDYLYINNKNGTFTDKLKNYIKHISNSSMGSDINDINNDGLEDIFVLDMAIEEPVRQKQLFSRNMNYDKFQLSVDLGLNYQYPHNTLQLNNGNGTFTEIASYANVSQTDWSWAPLIADYDNDGNKDIYITNGLLRDVTDWDYKEYVLDSIKNLMAKGIYINLEEWYKLIPQVRVKNYIYHNNGTLKFDNYSNAWSDEPPSFSNGAAYADLDNDGDLDLVVNNVDDEAFVLRNNGNEINHSNYIRFGLYKNKDQKEEAYGTIVKLYDEKGNIQLQHYDPQRGFMSTCEHFLHFGLGKQSVVAKAEITFSNGKQIILNNVPANQVLKLFESDALIDKPKDAIKQNVLLKDVTQPGSFKYNHQENNFIDFKREPLIPYKCSRKGPYYAMADVNNDGRIDIFIGGAKGFAGKLMIQNIDGSFLDTKEDCFLKDKNFEDSGVLFFDADGDGDNDLYVVSGGAEFAEGSEMYQDRLYLNDGKGNFKAALSSLPKETNNGSAVIAMDFDNDGDLDLFVGGAVKPGKFPNHDANMLLQNNKGIFTDVINSVAPDLSNAGIVNCAIWADVNGDKKNELVLSGEWMPVSVYEMNGGKLIAINPKVEINEPGFPKNVSLSELTGWWNCIKAEDIDNDGDLDLVVGNRGLNSKIKASIDEPCTVYGKDFDNNKSYDAVLGYYIQGKCYPMYHRDQIIDQMPFMRKKFIRYHQYAGKTLDDLFSEDQKKGMQIFKTTFFNSGVLLNDGNYSFHFTSFPEYAQLSNINDLVVDDFDKDGIKDIISCGNSFDPDVTTGNYDGVALLFLKGNGKGDFIAQPQSEFSSKVSGEVRKLIQLKENNSLILLKNNNTAQVFSYK